MSCEAIIKISRRRGPFRHADCNSWVEDLIEQWQALGNQLSNLVLVYDIAPCHSQIENVSSEVTCLRLGPYSPMFNPVETLWSSLKSSVKSELRVPQVQGLQMGEQRLVYLENIVQESINGLSDQLRSRAHQHTTAFHSKAMNFEDMSVGQ